MSRWGWKKDKFDKRDYLHTPLVKIPTSAIIKEVPSARDQGDEGSCIGFGLGVNLTILSMNLGVGTEWFSPRYIYNGARFIEGTLKEDSGAYPKDGLEWLRAKGCLLEHFWPYVPLHDLTVPPSSSLNAEAAKYPILKYYRITGGTDSICSAIASGYPVSIGTPWFEKWMDPPSTGKLATVTKKDYMAGGHETCLFGYDQTTKYFAGINSWSTDWGKGGNYLMPFSAFKIFNSFGGYDAHYITVEWVTVPTPEPPPDPTPTVVSHRVRLQDSIDGGKTWSIIVEKDL